jgi:hypothetical protein
MTIKEIYMFHCIVFYDNKSYLYYYIEICFFTSMKYLEKTKLKSISNKNQYEHFGLLSKSRVKQKH